MKRCENMSHLVDGCSPDIDTVTRTSDWIIMTLMKSDSTNAIPVTHVLLTFRFDTAVSLTGIELDLLLCQFQSETQLCQSEMSVEYVSLE